MNEKSQHQEGEIKPSDFAGAWVMSNEEKKKIKGSLKELWGTWKMNCVC